MHMHTPTTPGRRQLAVCLIAALLLATRPGASAPQDTPVFRAGTSIVTVNVVVRDRTGNIVRNLTADDFIVSEDGKQQSIETLAFEDVGGGALAPLPDANLLGDVAERLGQEVQRAAGVSAAAPVTPSAAPGSSAFAGRRLFVLLFDISSMQPEDVQRAVEAGITYADTQMNPADMVSVVTIGSALTVLSDFTNDRAVVRQALQRLSYSDGTATPPEGASTLATDEAAASDDAAAVDSSGFDTFNNDVRLRALKTLADTLAPLEQKKAILYFSAGMQRSGEDNQVELRAAINAAVRANVAIYSADARGLQALPPGGDASRASAGGVGLFSGRAAQQQFASLATSQDTLASLSGDTGGRLMTDSNDFGEVFTRAQRDLSAYYMIGYASPSSTKDGKFRRIQVRVKRKDLTVEARAGYYADRDFSHTNTRDREAQLEDQLGAAVSSTDVPMVVSTNYFRQAKDRFFVPIALAIPGSSVPVGSNDKATLDVRGLVRDEQGRPVGRIKDTLVLPGQGAATLAGRQVLYQSDVTLPPGRFSVKVVVRENATGAIGSFEAPIAVPQLRDTAMKISSLVLSTQLQPADRAKTGSPLVRDGIQLLPNLTRVVTRAQNAYFYFEVYDPTLDAALPEVKTSLAFYRGNVKVFETPVVQHAAIDDPGRHAMVFQFQVPIASLTPGTYTCQFNVIDAVAGRAAFPRLSFVVRE